MHSLKMNVLKDQGVLIRISTVLRISPTSFLTRFLGDDDFVLVIVVADAPRGDAVLHPRATALGSAARVEIIMVGFGFRLLDLCLLSHHHLSASFFQALLVLKLDDCST